ADASGGALLGDSVVISQAGFYSNTANLGGAVTAVKSVGVSAATFVSNVAVALGGAIHAGKGGVFGQGLAVVGGSLFQGNQVTGDAFVGGLGGAIWITGALTINGSQLLSNTATVGGGGAGVAGSLQVISGTFRGNQGASGGAVWLQPGTLGGSQIADSRFD